MTGNNGEPLTREKWRVPGDKRLFREADRGNDIHKKRKKQQKTLKKSDPWIQNRFFWGRNARK
jgi:hypothetical protein